MDALSMTQVSSFTTAQIAAMTQDQQDKLLTLTSPLVIDLGEKGVEIGSVAKGSF